MLHDFRTDVLTIVLVLMTMSRSKNGQSRRLVHTVVPANVNDIDVKKPYIDRRTHLRSYNAMRKLYTSSSLSSIFTKGTPFQFSTTDSPDTLRFPFSDVRQLEHVLENGGLVRQDASVNAGTSTRQSRARCCRPHATASHAALI